MSLHAKIITLVILVVFSAFFSGVETALFSLSNLRVKYLARKKMTGAAAVERLKEKPQRLLITILIGNNIVNVGAAALATSIAYDFSLSHAVSITTGVMTLVILIFGEIMPKSLATRHGESIALSVAKLLQVLQVALFPFIIVFDYMTNVLTGTLKKKESPLVTEDEIKSYISIGEEAGQIKESEKEMIQKIFNFNDIDAKDVMTPRNKMVCVPYGSKIRDIIGIFTKKGNARLPVYKDNLDNITGFVYIFDVQEALRKNKNASISKITRPVLFVPSSIKLDSLLKFFQHKKQLMAIVVDEFGTNIGLVTMEDVVEEIVGEIIDEAEKISPLIKRISRNSYFVHGRANIDEINEKCGLKLPEKEGPYTVASHILHRIGRIPKEGEVIIFPECEIKIRRMDQNTISEVVITRKKPGQHSDKP